MVDFGVKILINTIKFFRIKNFHFVCFAWNKYQHSTAKRMHL